jgi:hypothetical protein
LAQRRRSQHQCIDVKGWRSVRHSEQLISPTQLAGYVRNPRRMTGGGFTISTAIRARVAAFPLALAVLSITATANAGSTHAPLVVEVTVARSCAVDTQAVSDSSSSVLLACTQGADDTVLISDTLTSPVVTAGATVTTITPAQANTKLRIVTVNF